MGLRLRVVTASAGLAWVRQSLVLFARKPAGFAGLFALVLIAMLLSALVPMLGSLLLLGSLPLLSLAFMTGAAEVAQGGNVHPAQFVQPLLGRPERRKALLVLGAIYAVGAFALVELSSLVDGGALDALMMALSHSASPEGSEQLMAAASPQVWQGLAIRFGGMAVMSIPLWHAPALVHWGGQGVMQSLFSSTLAIWRNRGAFTVYMVAWTALVMGAGLGVALLLGVFGLQSLGTILMFPLGLALSAAFYISTWYTFTDCFIEED